MAQNTVDNYMEVAIHRVNPTLEKTRLRQLTDQNVDRLLARTRDASYVNSTVKRVCSVLAQALD